jgi:hypothetical protein
VMGDGRDIERPGSAGIGQRKAAGNGGARHLRRDAGAVLKRRIRACSGIKSWESVPNFV